MKKRFKNSGAELVSAMNGFQKALEANGMVKANPGVDAIRKIHARGPQAFDPDFLQMFEADSAVAKNRTVSEIRKAHQHPLRADITSDALGLSKAFAARGMRKIGFPPLSSNASNTTGIAATGATNSWKDQIVPSTKPTRVGGQVVTDVSRSPNIDAALDAIKKDLARGAKRIGA